MSDLPPIPQSVSGCAVESTLREGPGAVVARARDGLGLPVDLHFFHADTVSQRVPREIFFDQVRTTAAIHSDRLCAVVNAGEKGPWWFVATKGSEGATLAHLFGRGHLDEERALGIFAAVADGLAALEAAGLRHGGLDPQAVSLPGAGQVILGLRRFVPVDLTARDPCYLSPEEARGEDWGIASDLFSLGLLLFEALHGRPAMEGSPDEVRVRLARGTVPRPDAVLRGILPQTVELLCSLLAPDPRMRPASAADTARRLRMLQSAFSATESLDGSLDAPLQAVPVVAPPNYAPPAYAPPAYAPPAYALPGNPPPAPSWAPPGAAAAPPVLPSISAPPPALPAAPSLRARRAHARLVLSHRDVEQIHELLDPVTFVGLSEESRLVARNEPFPGAVARFEVGASVDSLVATGVAPVPEVDGQPVQRHELRFGEVVAVGRDEVAFEKAEKLLPEGAEGTEQESAHRVRKKPSKSPMVAGILLCLGAAAWGGLRVVNAHGSREGDLQAVRTRLADAEARLMKLPALESSSSGADRGVREEAAIRLLDHAREERDAGRSRPCQEKLETLLRQYPDTGAALLAAEDLKSVRVTARLAGSDDYRAAQAQADGLAAEGKLAEAQDVLLRFAATHPGTLVGDRAATSASTLSKAAVDRVDDLLRQAHDAAERKDWQTALDAAARAVASAAPGECMARAREEQTRIRSLMPSSAPGGPTPIPDGRPRAPPPPPTGGAPGGGTPPAPPPAKKAPTHDDEATALFRSCRESLDAGRAGEAERGLYRLMTEYKDTRLFRDYGVEVQQRYFDALKKGHGVAGLFRGGVQFPRGRLSLTYQFEDPAELQDWETVHPFAVPQKGTFRLEGGELAAEGAAALMLRACFRPDSASMTFKINPGPPAQDMGAMMAEPKDLSNNLLFTIANDFFKLGKGAAAYAVPGNVIFVFGKGMWAKTDPGMVGFVRTAAAEEPKVAPRKWTEIEVAKERDRAKFVIDGKPLLGRAVGDNKYELTGVRPALFVLLSEARFDEVTVEGDLDPEWVKAEHERLFPELK